MSTSRFRLFWKSSWSKEPSGTTGCNRCVEWRHYAQIFTEHLRQSRMSSSPCVAHFFTGAALLGFSAEFTGAASFLWKA